MLIKKDEGNNILNFSPKKKDENDKNYNRIFQKGTYLDLT